jgi:hypothetical protein
MLVTGEECKVGQVSDTHALMIEYTTAPLTSGAPVKL